MTLDGYPIEVGDRVYDSAMGAGVVEAIVVAIVVRFGSVSYPYAQTGFGPFRQRTLWWSNPVMSPPSKDPKVREAATKIFNALNQTLKDLFQ